MDKILFDKIISICKEYIDSIMENYTKEEKELASFEKIHMSRYSGNASVDHVLFRNFLRRFVSLPIDIDTKQDATDESLATEEKSIVGAINEVNKKLSNVSTSSTMDETFITNMSVGGIGSGIEIKADDEVKTIIKNMLLKLKYAFVKKYPSVSFSGGGDVEYGTTVTPTFTPKFNDGQFTQYINGGVDTEDIYMGCKQTGVEYKKKVGVGSYEDYTNGTSFKVSSTTTIEAKVSYSGSTAKPTNSDGTSTEEYGGGAIEATTTYTPRLAWFFTTLDSMPNSVSRSTFGDKDGLVLGAFNTEQKFDKKVVLLAIPNTYKLSSALSSNEEEQSNYTESSITIADIGGTDRTYKLYAFEYGSPLDINVTLKIITE